MGVGADVERQLYAGAALAFVAMRADQDIARVNLKHWRPFPGIFGLGVAPVLVFNHRTNTDTAASPILSWSSNRSSGFKAP
jgi:hypothetical protein